MAGTPGMPSEGGVLAPSADTSNTDPQLPAGNALLALPGLFVARPDRTPVLSLATGKVTLGQMTATADVQVAATLTARLGRASAASARAARGRSLLIGGLKATMKRGESRPLRIRVPAKVRKRLRGTKRLRVRLVTKAKLLPAGETAAKRQTITLKVR